MGSSGRVSSHRVSRTSRTTHGRYGNHRNGVTSASDLSTKGVSSYCRPPLRVGPLRSPVVLVPTVGYRGTTPWFRDPFEETPVSPREKIPQDIPPYRLYGTNRQRVVKQPFQTRTCLLWYGVTPRRCHNVYPRLGSNPVSECLCPGFIVGLKEERTEGPRTRPPSRR